MSEVRRSGPIRARSWLRLMYRSVMRAIRRTDRSRSHKLPAWIMRSLRGVPLQAGRVLLVAGILQRIGRSRSARHRQLQYRGAIQPLAVRTVTLWICPGGALTAAPAYPAAAI